MMGEGAGENGNLCDDGCGCGGGSGSDDDDAGGAVKVVMGNGDESCGVRDIIKVLA